MSTAYVFQLIGFPPLQFRDAREGAAVEIDIEPPSPDCVMVDWKLDGGQVFIRWRKMPGPGDVTKAVTPIVEGLDEP